MTKTTKTQGRTAEQIDRGWKAIERQAMGPKPVEDKIEVGSEDSGFDEPPARTAGHTVGCDAPYYRAMWCRCP